MKNKTEMKIDVAGLGLGIVGMLLLITVPVLCFQVPWVGVVLGIEAFIFFYKKATQLRCITLSFIGFIVLLFLNMALS